MRTGPHLKGLIRKEVEATQTCVSSSVGGTCVEPDKKEMSKGAKVTINIGEGDDIKHPQLDLTRPLHWMQAGTARTKKYI